MRRQEDLPNGTVQETEKNGMNIMFPVSFPLPPCPLWDSAEKYPTIEFCPFRFFLVDFFPGKTLFLLENQGKNVYIPS